MTTPLIVPVPQGFYILQQDQTSCHLAGAMVYVLRVVAVLFIVKVEVLTCEGELKDFYYPYKGPSNVEMAESRFWSYYQKQP